MGLLDDAIREHLDLKRRRGADPTEIERAEREALGPVRREPMPMGEPPADPVAGSAPEPLVLADEHAPYPADEDAAAPRLEDLAHDELVYEDEPHFEPERIQLDEPVEERRPRRRFFGRRDSTAEPEPASGAEPEPSSEPLSPSGELSGAEPLPPSEFDDDDPFLHDHDDAALEGGADTWEPLEEAEAETGVFAPEPVGHDDEGFEPADEYAAPSHPLDDSPPASPPSGDATRIPMRPSPPARPVSSDPPEGPAVTDDPLDQEPGGFESSEEPAGFEDPEEPAGFEEPQDLSGQTAEYDVERSFVSNEAPPEPPSRENPEPEEDVLEETPDFLQDTPDHDRLWFEQKPPRDFDFDG